MNSFDQLNRIQPISVPSTVYVKLKGHAFTLDEHQQRRNIVTKTIYQGCKYGNMNDETYLIIRRVREPVMLQELSRRKLKLFKEKNTEFLTSISPLFANQNNIKLTTLRLKSFIEFYQSIIKFISNFQQDANRKLEQLRVSEAYQLPGLTKSEFQPIDLYSSAIFSSSLNIRDNLFPEKDIV